MLCLVLQKKQKFYPKQFSKFQTLLKNKLPLLPQVTQELDQISDVVQTNSATAGESAATSEELSGQA